MINRSKNITILIFTILMACFLTSCVGDMELARKVPIISEDSVVKTAGDPFIWERTMGPGGGVIRGALAIANTNPNILYAGSDISGVFKTEDCGDNWVHIDIPHFPIEGRSIAIDYSNSDIVYVGQGDGIYKTFNGGGNWEKIYSTQEFLEQCRENPEIGGCGITSITIDPTNSQVIYAGNWGGQLIKSTNGGKTWKHKQNGLDATHIISKIIVDPTDPKTVYVATGYWDTDGSMGSDGIGYPGPGDGIFKSVNGGNSWAPINHGLPTWTHLDRGKKYITINDLEIDTYNPNTLYALTAHSPNNRITAYKSTNAGNSWTPLVDPEFGSAESIAVDPTDPKIIYISNGKGRIKKSTDGGKTWRLITGTALKTNPFFIDIVIDPINTNNIYGASYYKGIVKSTDGGETWVRANNGINIANSYFIAVDQTDSDIVYAGALESVLFGTQDAGDHWQVAGLEFLGLGYVYGILIDTDNPNTIYAGTGWQAGIHTDGIFKTTDKAKTWRAINNGIGESSINVENGVLKMNCRSELNCTIFYDTHEASTLQLENPYNDSSGIWIHADPGENYTVQYKHRGSFDAFFILVMTNDGGWRVLHEDNHYGDFSDNFKTETFSFKVPEDGTAIAIRIDSLDLASNFDDISLTKVGATENLIENGNFTKGMAHWSYLDTAVTNRNIYFLEMDPLNSNVIYAGTENGYMYKTTNGGESWQLLNGLMMFSTINAIVQSPIDPDTICVGTNSKYVDGGGIFKSEDGGDSWTQSQIYSGESERSVSMASPRYAYAIAIDPSNPKIMYSGEAKLPVFFKSLDGSKTWTTKLDFRDNPDLYGVRWIEVDPNDPERVYAGFIGDKGTIYFSKDKGETWDMLNENLTFTTIWGHSQLQIDRQDKNIVYAGTWGGGTYKTMNGGASWEQLDEEHTFSPTCISIAPSDRNIVYACDRTNPIIHRSDDGGKTWHDYYTFRQPNFMTSAVAVSKNDPNTVYAAAFSMPFAHGGAFVKIQNGVAISSAKLPRSILDVELDPNRSGTIYVTTHIHGVFKSIDDGATWKKLDDHDNGLPRIGFYDIDVDPKNSNIIYATALCGELPDYMMVGGLKKNLDSNGRCGVYKSDDAGQSWNRILETVSEARGIDIDPIDSNNLYVADMMGGIWVSNDAGQTWRQENNNLGSISMTSVKVRQNYIYAGTQGSGVYAGVIKRDGSVIWDRQRSNKPRVYVSNMQIKVDHRNSNRIYASAYPGGLLRSDDGGQHWNDKNFLTPSIKADDPFLQGYYSFDINFKNPNTIWMGVYGKGMFVSYDGMDYNMFANGVDNIMKGKYITAVVINQNEPSEVYAASEEGIFKTEDGGKNWKQENTGLEFSDVFSLALSRDGSTLYAGTKGAGIWRAETSDMVWERANGPQTEPRLCWIEIDPTDTNVIYIGFNPGGMYKTSDGGLHWKEINVGLTNTIVYPIAVNPSNTDEVFVGTGYKRDTNTQSGGGCGIYRSMDGGEHWVPANGGLTDDIIVNDIKFDPKNSDVIYIGTEGLNSANEGIFMSTDKGETWVPINNNGIEEFPIYAIEFDSSGNVVYVGTGFGGVWRGVRKSVK